jgi:hypothetical protein
MKIRTLDIDELNDRLAELEGFRDALESCREALKDAKEAAESPDGDGGHEEKEVLDAESGLEAAESDFGTIEADELKQLEALRDEIGESRGKINDEGGPFVHENDFEEYAQELAEDIGAIDRNASWPLGCIDWERAADELKMDYSSVEWNGDTYFYRP